MGVIEYYLLFAFSTSFTACYLWFYPLLQKARSNNVENGFTKNPKLSIFIYIIISTIVAPFLVLPLLFTKYAEAFERGLSKEILKQD
jgi:hypothetical protein